RRWFGYDKNKQNCLLYYRHWDAVLATGRRCFGFAVRDHRFAGRGRNVLLVPDPKTRTAEERHHDALKAYRNGHFFALVEASCRNAKGEMVDTEGHAQFRLLRLNLQRDSGGHPLAVEVEVGGQNKSKRPVVVIRFVTAQGVSPEYFPSEN